MKRSRSPFPRRSAAAVAFVFLFVGFAATLGWAQQTNPTPSREEMLKRSSGYGEPGKAVPTAAPEARSPSKAAAKAPERPMPGERPGAASAKPYLNPILRAGDLPTSRPVSEFPQKELPGKILKLNTPFDAEVYVPSGFKPKGDAVDVVVHFHGEPAIVEQNFEEAGLNAVLIVVNPGGRGSQYANAFSNPESFTFVLDNAIQKLRNENVVPASASWGRMALSSYSAGYGAVRELLYSAEYFNKTDAVILADSLYASFSDEPSSETRAIDRAQMRPFLEFAKLAAEGKKTFLITRSSIIPGYYAGSPETAAYLIHELGGVESAATPPRKGPDDMTLISRFDKGNFHVRGYAGLGPADSAQHLFNIAALFRQLPFDKKS